MITIELKSAPQGEAPQELEIRVDSEGLASLLSQLGFLRDGRTDHVDLFSASWGGGHLGDRPFSIDGSVIHRVKITLIESSTEEGEPGSNRPTM